MRHRTWIIAVLILTFASSGLTGWAAPTTAPASEQSSSTESSAPAASSPSEATSASSSDSASASASSSTSQPAGKKTTQTSAALAAAGSSPVSSNPTVNIDPQSASVSYSINMEVPPGRGGLQPQLNLTYNSNSKTDILGVGWQLDMLAIARSIRHGTPKYTSSDKYALAQNGSQQELLFDSVDNIYRPEIEGGFTRLQLSSGSWVMTDKKGTKYFFGTTQASQIYDPQTPANVFAWNLDKVQDINGNYMTITYLRDGNELYPLTIDYTGNVNGSISPYAHVDLIYENRPDVLTNALSGFKVTTAKRLKTVSIKASGNLVRRYDLNYVQSAVTGKSLLSEVVQAGSDGTSTLPRTVFSYNQKKPFWDSYSEVTPVVVAHLPDINSGSVVMMDMNADGYIDIMQLLPTGTWGIWFNQKNGQYAAPIAAVNAPSAWALDVNSRLIDLNGDGLIDVIYGASSPYRVWINKGEAGYAQHGFLPPFNVTNNPNHPISQSSAVTLIDMNGDGYMDMLDTSSGTHQIYMNDKTGNFQPAISAVNNPGIQLDNTSVKWMDLNGDGLLDLYLADSTKRVWINNGVNGWNAPVTLTNVPPVTQEFFTALDMNGDGLSDLLETPTVAPGDYKIYFNNGKNDLEAPVIATNSPGQPLNTIQFKLIDLNNDHLIDAIYSADQSDSYAWLNNGRSGFEPSIHFPLHPVFIDSVSVVITDTQNDGQVDFLEGIDANPSYRLYPSIPDPSGAPIDTLIKVDNSIGVANEILYGTTVMSNLTGAQFKVALSPFLISTAKKSLIKTGQGENYFTTYKYAEPFWSHSQREFRGFREVQIWDSDNNFSDTTYLQDDIFKGREEFNYIFKNDGSIHTRRQNFWDKQLINNVSNFVFLKRTEDYLLDGNGTGPKTAQEFFYEETPQRGNLTKTINYGQVDETTGADTGTDKYSVEVTYHNNVASPNYLVGLPKTTITKDNAGNIIHQSWFFYDGLNNLTTLPTKGLLTRKEDWNNAAQGSATNPKTQYSYDVYGNLKTTTDPKNNVTTINYDAATQLFPLTTLNALNHTLTNEYYGVNGVALDSGNGYRGLWGELKSTTDPNLQKGSRAYDVFGRVTAVVSPQDTIAYPTSSKEYAFTSQYVKLTTHERVTSGQAATLDAVQYYDGLGRLIQTKTPSATTGQYVVGGQTEYNLRGLPVKKYFPYFTANDFNTIDPIDTAKPKTTYDYDPMGRAIKTTSPDGTYASMIYDDWTLASIDENGHKQKSYFDAFGRLIKKEEYRGADGRAAPTYPASAFTVYATTLYTYDTDGNLLTTQDQNGNNTIISYDKLGRKITMNDPDMKNWQYVYDLNGNLTSQTDAKNQTINFTYDALNRLKTKTSATGGLNVTYTYDDASVAYSKGRLTKAQYPTDQTEFKYDSIGREIQSIKKINSVSFDVQRSYDDLNRLVTLQYPNQRNVKYTYNAAGQIEKVTGTFQQINPPAAPTNVTATAGNAQVVLNWTASSGATDGYKVKYGTTSGSYGAPINVGNTTSYTVTNLTNSTTYYFVVVAGNAGGDSPNSSEVSATPQAPPPGISLDAVSSKQAANVNTTTLAHTVTTSGIDRILIVGVTMREFGSTAPTITSMTYGGAP